jgi:hypothetical protein
VFERVVTLVIVLVVLAGGGVYVAKKLSKSHNAVSTADRRLMIAAVARKEPGAAFMSTKCGGATNNGGCTIYVRKGASRMCDGWLATISPDGQVALVGVGRKSC